MSSRGGGKSVRTRGSGGNGKASRSRAGRGYTHSQFVTALAQATPLSTKGASAARVVTMGGKTYTVRSVTDSKQAANEMAAAAMARAMGMGPYTVPVYPEKGAAGERYLVSPTVQGGRPLSSMSAKELQQTITQTLPENLRDRYVLYNFLTADPHRSLDNYVYVPPRGGSSQQGRIVIVQQPGAFSYRMASYDHVPDRFIEAADSRFGRAAFAGKGRGANAWEQHVVSRSEAQRLVDAQRRITGTRGRFMEKGAYDSGLHNRFSAIRYALVTTAAEDRPLRAGEIDDKAFVGYFSTYRPATRSYSREPGPNATFNYPKATDTSGWFTPRGPSE